MRIRTDVDGRRPANMQALDDTGGQGPVGRRRGALSRSAEIFALPISWVIVIAIFGVLRPDSFLTLGNFSTMFGSQAVLVVVTLALIIVMRAGDFDLSIASILTLSSMLVAVLNVRVGWPISICVVLAIAAGLLVGLVNGLMVTRLGIHSFIVTLGMGTVLQGIVLWISGSETITGVASSLSSVVVTSRLFHIPLEFYYGLFLTVVIWYSFEYTPLGKRVLLVGRSRDAANLSGVRVPRVRLGALTLSGGVSALAGILYAGTTGSADPSSGLGFLLPAFAAAFLGATSVKPGFFNPWGSFIAVYFLVTGVTGLAILGIQTFVQSLFYGAALLVAVGISQIIGGRKEQKI